jgi:hypothetical protein
MLILQPNANLNQVYTSSPVTVTSAGTVISTSNIRVNGILRASGYSVIVGDQVSIELMSSSQYSSHTFGTFTLDQPYTFCVVTLQNPTKVVDPLYYDAPPLAHTDPGWKPLIGAKLLKFNQAFIKTVYTLDRSASNTGSVTSVPYIFICDYFDHCVYRTNLLGDTLQRIVTPNPYSISYGHDNFGRAVPYITNTKLNQVTRLSTTDFTPDLTIPVQVEPKHIINDSNYHLWVANYGSNSVTRIQVDIGSQTPTTTHIPVGNGPLYLTSTLSHIYVSNSNANTITRIARSDLSTTTFSSGGINPWHLCVYGSRLYCANTSSLQISVIDLNTLTVLYSFDTGFISYITIKDQILYLVDQEQSVLYLTELDGTSISQHNLDETGILAFIDNDTWVYSNYSNMPPRLIPRDLVPTTQPIFSHVVNAVQSASTLSNTVTISGVSQALNCSLSGNAQFVKNSVPVGTSTTVTNGDTLAIEMTSASSPFTKLSVAIAIGHIVQEYSVTTAYAYNTPLPILWSSVVDADLDTDYTSVSQLITGINQTLNAVATNGLLVKNNTPYTNTSVVLNDSVQARARSSIDYWTNVISIIDFGNLELPYVVQTKGLPSLRLMDHSTRNLLPTEFTSAYTGLQDQELIKVDLSTYIQTSHVLTVPGSPNAAEYNNELDYILVIDHLNNRVLRVNTALSCVQSLSVTTPYDVCMSPGLSDTITETPFAFVTSSTLNQVLVFSRSTWTLVHTISVGTKPLGIAGMTGTYRFAVCCYDQDVVQIWNYTVPTSSSLYHTITLPAGSGPLKVVSDPTNTYLWIICSKTDKLVRYTIANNQVSTFNTDLAPWDLIVSTDLRVYVACAYSNTVQTFDQNGQLIQTLAVPGSIPIGVSYYEYQDKRQIAVCYYDSTGTSTDLYDVSTGTMIFDRSLITNERLIYGSTLLNNQLLVFRQYQDAPDRAVFPVQYPNITVQNLEDQPFNTVISTDVFTVSGLTRNNSPLSIPNLYGASIYKNNSNVGTSTTVSNGDQFYVRVTTGNIYYRYIIPIIFNGMIYDWTVLTQPDSTFEPVVFVPRAGLEPDTVVHSNIVTLTGVTLGLEFNAIVSKGTGIIHNGIDITNSDPEQDTEFTVQTLDTIQLYTTVKLPYSSISTHTLDLPNQMAMWVVETMNLRVYRYPYFRQHWANTNFDHKDHDPKLADYASSESNSVITYVVDHTYDTDRLRSYYNSIYYSSTHNRLLYQQVNAEPDTRTSVLNSTTYDRYKIKLFDIDHTYARPSYKVLLNSMLDPYLVHSGIELIPITYDHTATTGHALLDSDYSISHRHVLPTTVSYAQFNVADLILNTVSYWPIPSYELTLVNQQFLPKIRYKTRLVNHHYQQYAIEATTRVFQQYRRNALYDVLYDGQIFVKNYKYHQILYGQTFDQYFHDFILADTNYYHVTWDHYLYEHKYHQDPAFYWPIQLDPIIFQQTVRYIDVDYVKDFHTRELNSVSYSHIVHVKHNYPMPSSRHFEDRTLAYYPMPTSTFRPSSKKPTTLMPSGLIVAHVRRPTHTVRTAMIVNLHREFGNLPVPVALSETWFDNTGLYDCLDKSYYTSQALAESAAVGTGILPEHVLTLEIVPGCWVWAHKILVNPEECANLSGIRVRGWIRGG